MIIAEPTEMRAWSGERRERGKRIVLVPTMGYLHEGHLSLVRDAKRHGDDVLVSIFVNPTQFGPNEDLDRYPSDLEGDVKKLEELGVATIFTPPKESIYPEGFDTYVVPNEMAKGLCGASRPTHFRGVTTVVTLLFRITRCHAAVFGEKDFQQLQVIRRMTEDLYLDVEIIGSPIVREPDGLAMSSRNAYLTAEQRAQAVSLSRSLDTIERTVQKGERDVATLVAMARSMIAEKAPLGRIDYVELVDAATLQPIERITRHAVCALAVFFGQTRLIDNRQLLKG